MQGEYSLFDPRSYRLQLEKLVHKARQSPRRAELESEDVSLSAVYRNAPEFCARIAAEVAAGSYELQPLTRVRSLVAGKWRTLYRPELLDRVVLGAVAQRLTTLLEGHLSGDVYGYRPGRGTQTAISRVRRYLTEHRRERRDPSLRGVFVLQRDLSAFGESIPTHAESRLWSLVERVLSDVQNRREAEVMGRLVSAACRPLVRQGTDVELLTQGLPTGSPIQQPLANLYLTPLDADVSALEPGLYARFGDDMLIMNAEHQKASSLARQVSETVESLGLRFNATKVRDLYFTGPGRPWGLSSGPAWAPTSHLEYLGVRINFEGRLGLKRERQRQLVQGCRWRVENTIRLADPKDALGAVATTLREALMTDSCLREPNAAAVADWVDDRDQLRQLDRQLAQLCAEALSGVRGVRAFRRLPPKTLRAAGLPSLLELRRRKRRS